MATKAPVEERPREEMPPQGWPEDIPWPPATVIEAIRRIAGWTVERKRQEAEPGQ